MTSPSRWHQTCAPELARWPSKVPCRYLAKRGVHVHVSTSHSHYATAFRYLVLPSAKKPRGELATGADWFMSENHPSKASAATLPKTAKAIDAAKAAAKEKPEMKKRGGPTKRVRARRRNALERSLRRPVRYLAAESAARL